MMPKMKAFLIACILLLFSLAIFTAPASARPLVALSKIKLLRLMVNTKWGLSGAEKGSSPKPRPGPSPKCSIVSGKRICV
ncbi:hypothetical protein Gogos_020947 [Gossypium gossypioides]|uniref:Uncharacterized protein n=1 Tax=Gossypium gossypioides TaxID=34282 RepID=A0A7J9D1J6_GOSGO|nr:hypothetical protein [Gossypium gossypioides]